MTKSPRRKSSEAIEKLDQLEKVIDAIISEVKPGQLFTGKITRAEAYGFFVELAPKDRSSSYFEDGR